MGVLSEVNIVRLCDGKVFDGHSWAREDGSFEAFWFESGNRINLFFDCNGDQQGAWKKYKLEFKRG